MNTISKLECPCTRYELNKYETKSFYPKGTTIFIEGTPIFGLYCVCEGKIKLSRFEEDGKEIILQLINQGEMLGNRCFFSKSHFGMSATALEDSKVSFIEKSSIYDAIKSDVNISHYFLNSLGQELAEADKRTSTLIRKKVGERMAEFFLNTLKIFGKPEREHYKLDIHLSREEMASIIGTSSETITRFISLFKDNGLISEKKGNIYILDAHKLHIISKQPKLS